MRAKITKRTVDATKAEQRNIFVWDTETKGFGLKVTLAGRKVYLLQARLNGHLKRWTIGRHGSPWTPDTARTEAVRWLGTIADGIDPAEAKLRAKNDMTLSNLCTLYVEEGCTTKKPSTLKVEKGMIERHIKPLLGKRRLLQIDRAQVERFLRDVADGKTAVDTKTGFRGRAIVRGGRSTANRTIDLLSSILNFAVARGLCSDNPTRGVKKFRQEHRNRFLTGEELARLGEVLTAAETGYALSEDCRAKGEPRKSGRRGVADPDRGENPVALAAIRLLLLTGCRKSEVLSLQWDWVDFDRSVLRLADSKTGAKIVPLGAPALQLLQAQKRVEGSNYVFPSSIGEGHLVGLQKIWGRIRTSAGLADVRLHDLRHSFASVGVAGGDSLYIVGKLLGHTQARTTQRYAHLADDPVRATADKISRHIEAAMAGNSENNVVELATKR